MLKKIGLAVLLIILIAVGIGWYKFKSSKTRFAANSKIFYIYSNNANKEAILKALQKDSITDIGSFNWLADYMNLWKNIKPGRYKIKSGTSVYDLVKQFRNGIQAPVDLVISRKIRIKEDFAKLIGNNFECDSIQMIQFLNNNDSLRHFGLDSASWLTAIIHNTYSIPWTWPPSKIFKKLYNEQEIFWTKENRAAKAEALGYTPRQIYTLASIVAEETNREADKPNIASVYLNRLSKGVKLEADPTVKFAMKDFLLKRILFSHLAFKSPYNTYVNVGLPPGPICTVSEKTIDAVLDAPKTDYMFFVANADLNGGSSFSTTLAQHQKLAKEYQDSLTIFLHKKAEKEKGKQDATVKAPKP